ncbi:HAD-IA family hydrolase [Quadrisphaera sp. DSM 44207]|uniref:HAD-IA family hydrolase n=1 Tax=Quadrisphaera sp. DSM 44207 TaxID=1881057 RepID=UPI00088A6A83|nr:HAD-IA family hydrolase [Quadrisphaera sp. DSM 44207]SDQ77405.1 sugar-phosphatase [Quadrisphaera sp. DSM 44207]
MDLRPLPPPTGLPLGLDALTGRAFAAVLFDMDGTLVDSTPVVVRSWLRWAAEEGVDPARLTGMHGVPAAGIVERLLPAPRRAAAVARIDAIELQDVDGVVILPGAAQALAALPPGRAAIATSCGRSLARLRMAATGLAAPAVVVTADDVERGKPDPQPYLLAASRLGVDPAACLVVEDAPSGLTSARAAACATLAVATSHVVPELLAAGADAVVRDLSGVVLDVGDEGVRVRPAAASSAVRA